MTKSIGFRLPYKVLKIQALSSHDDIGLQNIKDDDSKNMISKWVPPEVFLVIIVVEYLVLLNEWSWQLELISGLVFLYACLYSFIRFYRKRTSEKVKIPYLLLLGMIIGIYLIWGVMIYHI